MRRRQRESTPTRALSTCVAATCGDGFVRAGVEECDDGNTANTDACLATCVAATCGDGFVHAGVEQCDDGNAINTDACLNTCAAASCGDGFVRAGVEECDDGNTIATDACTATVHGWRRAATASSRPASRSATTATRRNTDALRRELQGSRRAATASSRPASRSATTATRRAPTRAPTRACRRRAATASSRPASRSATTATPIDTDACRYNCIDAACGDGVVRDGVEECDDGNVTPGDGCSPACHVEGGTDPDEPGGGGGGCCQSSDRGSLGSFVLAGLVALGLRRRRRAAAR